MAYDLIEPFGDFRADLRSGIVAAMIANVNSTKSAKMMSPEDFLIKMRDPDNPILDDAMTEEQLKRQMIQITKAFKGKEK